MKLYEINSEILRLTDQIAVDEETGEVLCDMDEITAELECLQLERQSVLEYLAKLVLNLRAEAAAIKAEETRLRERRSKFEKKESRILEILDRECMGAKTDLGVATMQYRKTTRLDVTDAEAAIKWLRMNNYTDCFRIPAPEVAKNEVKKLITSGKHVPGCEVIEDRSYSLK